MDEVIEGYECKMIDYEDTNDRTEVVRLFISYGCMVHFLSHSKNQDTKLPDSLRGNGALSYLGQKIWEKRFPEELDMNFTTELCEQIWEDVYRKAEEEVESFLKKYPHPVDFPRFIEGNEKIPVLTQKLIKIYEGKFDEVYRMVKGYIERVEIFVRKELEQFTHICQISTDRVGGQ